MSWAGQPKQPEVPVGRRCMVQWFGEASTQYIGGPAVLDWHYCQNKTEHPAPTVLDFPVCDSCWETLR